MTLQLVPVDLDTAQRFVAMWHRHQGEPRGHKFSVGVADGELLVGVAIVGRPVPKAYHDPGTTRATGASRAPCGRRRRDTEKAADVG